MGEKQKGRGDHHKALSLLRELGEGHTDLSGTEETVRYLRDLAQDESMTSLVLQLQKKKIVFCIAFVVL